MTRPVRPAPTLKRHKRSGNGYARFNGRQYWFGHFDDPETHAKFAGFKARWEANGRVVPEDSDEDSPLRVADLVALYLQHAEVYYRRADGSTTDEVARVRYSVRPLVYLYGTLPAKSFSLRGLKEVREAMVNSGLARSTINIRMSIVVRVFRWGAEEEFVPPETFGALRALRPLQRGRTKARETDPVRAVAWKDVRATLKHLSTPLRDLVLLLWYTGMRPGEARNLTLGEVDKQCAVWHYRPTLHKTQHHGRERVIAIGPRGQEVLQPYFDRVPALKKNAPVFSPRDAMNERHKKVAKSTGGKVAKVPSKAKSGGRLPGDRYTKDSLARAIARACKLAEVRPWTPNQLRHAAATRIRRKLGIDAARAVLGHTSSDTTEVYAELDQKKAEDAMRELG